MTRSTSDVINDLDSSVTGNDVLYDNAQTALVVSFEHSCRMVFQDDPDRLKKLNTLVHGGGTPLGFIKITKVGKEVNFFSRPLVEFKDDPTTAALLTVLCTGLGKRIAHEERVLTPTLLFQESSAL